MAFIPVPDVAQVSVLQTLFGQEVVNVLHFQREGGYDLTTLTDLASAVRDRWKAEILPNQSLDLVMDGVRARNLAIQDGFQVEVQAGSGNLGAVNNGSLPGNVAFVVTHRTANIGRSRRGRTYLSGIAISQADDNAIAAPVASAFVTGFNNLRNTLAGLGFSFVVVSRYTNGSPRPFGISSLVIQTVSRDLFLDSQRGRLPG